MTDDLHARLTKAIDESYTTVSPFDAAKAADAAASVIRPELDRLNQEIEYLKRNIRRSRDQVDGYDQELTSTKASINRVRALHERREGDDGCTYCDVCSNHGDVAWPCATIRALDGAQQPAEPPLCAECGHPKADHQDADEPVSVGLCAACDAAGSDDAHHDYEPEEQQ